LAGRLISTARIADTTVTNARAPSAYPANRSVGQWVRINHEETPTVAVNRTTRVHSIGLRRGRRRE
jgi:hypothetical protein